MRCRLKKPWLTTPLIPDAVDTFFSVLFLPARQSGWCGFLQ
jgi:hypothetical protein